MILEFVKIPLDFATGVVYYISPWQQCKMTYSEPYM